MGSLFSPPKPVAVSVPQPYYVPVPAPTTTPTSTADTGATTPPPSSPPPSASQSGLLERSRGILSTVLTGFDGILTKSNVPHGKSLLGE